MSDTKTNDKLTLRDFYEQYWHCRDFEIKNLWQRSIFLGTFLVLCFTGYGVFFTNAFFSVGDNSLTLLEYKDSIINKHFIALFLTIVGCFFSLLWIAMAKASKAWVEVYERAIYMIEDKMGIEPCDFKDYISFNYHSMPNYKYESNESMFDVNFFSQKGGCFSPSRTNVIIGQTSLVIWAFLEVLHLVIIFTHTAFCCCEKGECLSLECGIFLSLFIITVQITVFVMILNKILYSDTLNTKDPKIVNNVE